MPVPKEQRLKFFVFVVESPSALDLFHRRSEGEIIRQAVNLNGIACHVVTAINSQAFEASLKVSLGEAMGAFPGLWPILHISAHGNCNGIQLSNGETIEWAVLRQYLAPINTALSDNLLVCLSSCEGYAGVRMAMFLEDSGYPFLALVANSEKPLWSDTAIAYSTFYHLIAKGEYIPDAVQAMCVASGNRTFFVQTAQASRQFYVKYLANTNAQQVQARLTQSLAQEDPGHLERLRKVSAQGNGR